jgi:glycosyltransferase involved in cell wall biosynthesis
MLKIALVRGAYLNNFEGQNFRFIDNKKFKTVGVSTLFPIEKNFLLPRIGLPSIADLQKISFLNQTIKFFANRLIGDSQILFGLEKLVEQFDLFHSADPHYYYSYQLAKLRKNSKIKKLILTSWETIPFNNESVAAKKRIKYFSLKHSDQIICYTKRAKLTLIKEGVEEKKIKVIRLGVDLNRFKPKITKKNHLTILFVGRLVDEKGIMDLYKAIVKVKKEFDQVKLKVVGDGLLKEQLIKLIRQDYLENDITFTSSNYKNMPKIYQSADMIVVPSKTTKTWEEQYGMVLVEAMASGLPIIAYHSGAIEEVVGNAAILVDEGEINNLTKQLILLINNKNLRVKLGKMGRRRAEREFDARKTARKFEEIYQNLFLRK